VENQVCIDEGFVSFTICYSGLSWKFLMQKEVLFQISVEWWQHTGRREKSFIIGILYSFNFDDDFICVFRIIISLMA